MKQKDMWTVIIVAVVVAVLASVVTVNVMKNNLGLSPGGRSLTDVNANRCEADGVCEVAGVVQAPNALTLRSNSGFTKVEGDLTLTKVGQSGGTVFETNNQGSLTITPSSGNAKLEADLTLTREGYSGGVVLKSNELGSLLMTPSSGFAKVEGALSVSNLEGSGNAYVCVNQGAQLFRSATPCV